MRRKITQSDLDKLKARGVTVESKGVPKKEKPALDTSIVDAISKIDKSNKEVVTSLGEELKTLADRPRQPWLFTINRDNKGRLESVVAEPI